MTNHRQKRWQSALCFLLTLVLIGTMLPLTALADTPTSFNLNINSTQQIVAPGNGEIVGANSDSPSVASVTTLGNVTGLANGTAKITITYKDSNATIAGNRTQVYTITVGTGTATTNTTSNVTVNLGESATVGTYGRVWSAVSNGTGIASITSTNTTVTVYGVSAGTTTLTLDVSSSTAAAQADTRITVNVTVNNPNANNNTNTPMAVSETLTVGQKATPAITYSSVSNQRSTNEAVAKISVENNKVTIEGVGPGTATITFTATPSNSTVSANYTYNITVTGTATATPAPTATPTAAASISNSSDSDDSDDDNKGVATSDDKGIVFVKDKYSLSVSKKSYKLKDIELDGDSVEASDLFWLSTDSSVVSIKSSTGAFKAKSKGSAYIVAVDIETGYTASAKITVK